MIDPGNDPAAEPASVTCDFCIGGFVPCDIDCDAGCTGPHKCVNCKGTGKQAVSVEDWKDNKVDADFEAERDRIRGL